MPTQLTKPSFDRPQVLLLTQRVPFPPNRGDRIRAFHILRYLSDFSDVSLGCVADEPVDKSHVRTLEQYCRQVAIGKLGARRRWIRAGIGLATGRSATEGAFYNRNLARVIETWTSALCFDAAIIYCSSMGTYRRFFRQRPKRVLVDLVDVDSQKWFDYGHNSSGVKRLLYHCEADRVRSLERELSLYADAVSVVSEDEAAVFRQCHNGLEAHSISNGVDLVSYHPDAVPCPEWQEIRTASPQLVFVGVLDYLPNLQGLTWFCKSILPHIRREFPNARLDVVGRKPTAQVEALSKTDGVRLVGEVDDVRPYVLASHIVIAPLQIARGIQNKVLEGLACGRPVIASTDAAAGIKTRSGLFVADDPQAWLEHIHRLSIPETHQRACIAAREGVANLYSWNSQLAPLTDLLKLTTSRISVRTPPARLTEQPIRVGFCLHAMQVAGAEVLVSQIIETLGRQIQPHIFCLDDIGQLGKELQSSGVPVIVLGRKPGIDLSLAKRYASELNARQIQVVHAHQYTPFFYSALARLRGANRTKILTTEHGRHYPDLVSRKRRLVNRWLLTRYTDHTTACCRFSADAMERLDGFRNVEVLYNGIQLNRHPLRLSDSDRQQLRIRLGLAPDLNYIVCIARFHPVKDHGTLVRAFAILKNTHPKTRLILVGTGPEQSTIESIAGDLAIRNSIEFWGIRRDISDILQACDVFSLTSVSEASSITLLEAMANGCPVAVTDVGGNGEHVTHQMNGLLSPRGDAQALSENLRSLLNDPGRSRSMAVNARKRIEKQFLLEHAIARYAELYEFLSH